MASVKVALVPSLASVGICTRKFSGFLAPPAAAVGLRMGEEGAATVVVVISDKEGAAVEEAIVAEPSDIGE